MIRVLIVDDESLQREYLCKLIPMLDSRFSIVGEVSEGREALSFMEQHPVDLLITDIKMPLMNGLELCQEVYQRFPWIKIVILSGYEEFEFAKEALNYKVEAYLLKPLNRLATRDMLNRAAGSIAAKKAEETAFQGLLVLSDEAKQLAARRFLQALLAASQAEINTLFPLVHRLKIPLFAGEGLLLLLTIDEYTLFLKQIPFHDISIFQYILNQVASEIAGTYEMAWTLFDEHERTAILLSNTETGSLKGHARRLFNEINAAMKSATQLSLTGGIGVMIEDVLQLDTSYQTALEAANRRFFNGGDCLYDAEDHLETLDNQFYDLWVNMLNQVVEDHMVHPFKTALKLIETMNWPDIIPIPLAYSLGSFLIRAVTHRHRKWPPTQVEQAWKTLGKLKQTNLLLLTKEFVAHVFQDVLASFSASVIEENCEPHMEWSEQSLMEQIRHFIDLHYAEPVSLAMIADKFDLSQQYISTAFRKNIGMPYIKYMTNVRMKQATRLLDQKPAGKISDIAEQVGYLNVKHFSYVFRKHYGMTPGDYQER